MNFRKFMTLLAIVTVSLSMIYGSCNKDDDDPAPVPTPYSPGFDVSSISGIVGGIEAIEFAIRCTTDDVELVRIDVRAPDGSSGTYTGGGDIWLKDEMMYIPDTFPKVSGTWSFTISGTIKSGSHNGEGYSVSKSVPVGAK